LKRPLRLNLSNKVNLLLRGKDASFKHFSSILLFSKILKPNQMFRRPDLILIELRKKKFFDQNQKKHGTCFSIRLVDHVFFSLKAICSDRQKVFSFCFSRFLIAKNYGEILDNRVFSEKKWLLQNEMNVREFGYLLKIDPTRLKGAKQRSN